MIRYAFLALVLSFVSATAASASWVARDLNLRAGPGTSHHVRAVLPRCANVQIHRRHHNWYQVTWRGHRGWVAGQHLARHRPQYCGHARQQYRQPPQHTRPPAHLHPRQWTRYPPRPSRRYSH